MTKVVLNGPVFSQRDNARGPQRSCNVTSIAMCLNYLGMRGNGEGQFEDQLYKGMEDKGLSHGDPGDLSYYTNKVGNRMKPPITSRFHAEGSLKLIQDKLDKGYPCVVHGWFTQSGHIVAVFGYDSDTNQVLIHDPWGEWHSWGYDPNASGVYWLSNETFLNLCDEGGIWVHTFTGGNKPTA